MENTEGFSVVIPAHNVERFIQRSIGSVLSQTFSNLEVIVVENGSEDSTSRIVDAIEDSRVKLIKNPESGVSAARNTGISAANYNWIALLDADDEWLPHHLESAAKILLNNKDVKWYSAAYSLRAENGSKIRDVAFNLPRSSNNVFPDYLVAARSVTLMNCSTGIIHKDVFRSVGLFDESLQYGEDLNLWFRIGLKFPRIAYSPRVAGYYHLHQHSATGANTHHDPERSIKNTLKLIDICITENPSRIPQAKSLIANRLDNWVRLCAKSNRRDLLDRMDQVDSRFIDVRIRFYVTVIKYLPARILTVLRNRSDYVQKA